MTSNLLNEIVQTDGRTGTIRDDKGSEVTLHNKRESTVESHDHILKRHGTS